MFLTVSRFASSSVDKIICGSWSGIRGGGTPGTCVEGEGVQARVIQVVVLPRTSSGDPKPRQRGT